jgi:hypothetical protein
MTREPGAVRSSQATALSCNDARQWFSALLSPDRLVALCPPCHAYTDAPYARGRLVITPLGAVRFTVEVAREIGGRSARSRRLTPRGSRFGRDF